MVGMVRECTEVSLVTITESKIKTVTRVIQYKFSIVNSPKINTLSENCHHFLLAYQNSMKPTYLKRGNTRIPQEVFLAQRV